MIPSSFFILLYMTYEYKTGMKNRVMKVELTRPPTTATPIG